MDKNNHSNASRVQTEVSLTMVDMKNKIWF